VRDDNFVHAVGLGNSRCVSLVRWNDILLNIVMDVIDVLNVLLMIIWAVEVDEAVWMLNTLRVVSLYVLAVWWLRLLVATAMAVGLTRIVIVVLGIVIVVRHLVVLRLARFLNGCFIWV